MPTASRTFLLAVSSLMAFAFHAAAAVDIHTISDLRQWDGLESVDEAGDVGEFASGQTISHTYPDGEKGWHRSGFFHVHDGSANWRPNFGIRFDLYVPNETAIVGQATIVLASDKVYGGSKEVSLRYNTAFGTAGAGWQTVTIPLNSFDFDQRVPITTETIKTFELTASFGDGNDSYIKIRNPHLIKADIVALESVVRSLPGEGGEDVVYSLKLSNATNTTQIVNLSQRTEGREVMSTVIQPTEITLAPGESKHTEVRVTVSERMAPGAKESQYIQAIANGKPAGEMEFITSRRLQHPYLLHTKERWDDIREKAATVDWAKEAAREHIEFADNWELPDMHHGKLGRNTHSRYLVHPNEGQKLLKVATAYQLTGELKYAEKVASFLRELNHPETGFLSTNQASSNALVHEGGFFQHIAWSYDTIYESGVLTEEDHANMAATFRRNQKIIDQHVSNGTIGNWQVAEICGALYGALVTQDMVAARRFIEGPGGFYDQFSHGVMGDGWWYECSISYNTWVAAEFTQLALAMQPFGVNYIDATFPATYSKEYNILPIDVEERKKQIYGKPFQKWGPTKTTSLKIKDMWDALPPYIDYDGVMFANNDSLETKFKDSYYEIAYFVYGDPIYASIIKNTGKRDLLYGVAELPEDTPELGVGSAFSDNAGQTMLRSTAEEPRERIQAVLKYGTHGGYHGHFDRTALNSLMRYGRSFYNPEHIWFGYPNFMYSFFVQSSLPHNMVVVDMKQQEAVESHKLLFSTGDLMQATAVETNARWSNPPYGGLVYKALDPKFQDKAWSEGRYMPVPENEPVYGSIGEWSDRVMQRRLLAVTDDYVILADYLDAEEEHIFDCIFNIKGFQGIKADTGADAPARHTESMNPDPILAAQLITDCSWYETTGTTKVSFETQFGPDADNAGTRIYGQPGPLKMDVYNAWPKEREVMIGALPENHRLSRRFWYSVKGDGEVLTEGKLGAWVIGRDEIDVPLEGVKTLTLQSKADFDDRRGAKTLFWGDPVIVTSDEKELRLSDLELTFNQIDNAPAGTNLDYKGGPVKISGRHFEHSVPANPTKSKQDGTVTIDLNGLDAVRFKSSVGGDFPVGDETWRRKSLSFRSEGMNARFLTVIEPFENQPVVKSVEAHSANRLTVELTDGRTHKIELNGLESGEDLSVHIQELKDDTLIREEIHQ